MSSLLTFAVTIYLFRQTQEMEKAVTNLSEALIMLTWLSKGEADKAAQFQESELIGSIRAFERIRHRPRLVGVPHKRRRLLDRSVEYIQRSELKVDLKEFGFDGKDDLVSVIVGLQ